MYKTINVCTFIWRIVLFRRRFSFFAIGNRSFSVGSRSHGLFGNFFLWKIKRQKSIRKNNQKQKFAKNPSGDTLKKLKMFPSHESSICRSTNPGIKRGKDYSCPRKIRCCTMKIQSHLAQNQRLCISKYFFVKLISRKN